MKPTQKVRVLIVEDSMTVRRLIRARLNDHPGLEVVGEAVDPLDARDKIRSLRPDVLTLDVEMPRMSGIEFLEQLMRQNPMPVIMVSTLTQKGSAAALEALSLGAIDCVGKPSAITSPDTFANLGEIVHAAARARVRPGRAVRPRPAMPVPTRGSFLWNGKYVLIGSSTGGVDALETILSGFPENCPATLITQHMPASFLDSFAKRLNSMIAPRLELAQDGLPLEQGRVYLAPGGDTHLTVVPGLRPVCRLLPGEKRSGHRPSVDMLFGSASPIAPKVVSVLLTGMGRDGAEEMKTLRDGGARCLAQDEASCVVYGMPRAAVENGGAERSVPLKSMTDEILELSGRGVR